MVLSVCLSVSKKILKKDFLIVDTPSKRIEKLEISYRRTSAYLKRANAVHYIHNSSVSYYLFRTVYHFSVSHAILNNYVCVTLLIKMGNLHTHFVEHSRKVEVFLQLSVKSCHQFWGDMNLSWWGTPWLPVSLLIVYAEKHTFIVASFVARVLHFSAFIIYSIMLLR